METLFSSIPRSPWLRRSGIALALLALGWAALRSQAEAPPKAGANAAVPVTLARVQQHAMPLILSGVGTVQALQSVTVRTRVDGQLDRVAFAEGQDVKAGQLLAHIDDRALRAQLEQVQAQKARDEAQLANARIDLARYEGLIKEQATTQQTLDTQRALVGQLEAAVQTDTAQVHYAQVQLDYATITAPIAGRTGARLVDAGNIVHAADATGMVVINQIDPITVLFTLPGDSVPAVNRALLNHLPLPVTALARADGHALASGELVLLNNQIDIASGTVQLKARFANAGHALWPGQYVDVRLQTGTQPDALTVPAQALQRGPAGPFVFAVDAAGKAQVRPVTVARTLDGVAVIAQGLQAGETVVTDGQYKLRAGVAVASAASAAAAGHE